MTTQNQFDEAEKVSSLKLHDAALSHVISYAKSEDIDAALIALLARTLELAGGKDFLKPQDYIEAFNKMEAALRGATAHKAPAPVPTAPAAPLTLRDKQLSEFTRLFDQLTPANRKLWLSHTSGFVWGCASTSPTEMAYLV